MRHRNESAPLILEQGGKRKKKRGNIEGDFDCNWAEALGWGRRLSQGGCFPESARVWQVEAHRKDNPCASVGGETDFADMQVGQRL